MPIELRHRTYFAYLDVPKDVRVKLGRRVFRKTLGTDSRSVAKRRAANWIEKWKAEIDQARGRPNADDVQYWRDASERATTDEERMIVEARMFRDALRRATVERLAAKLPMLNDVTRKEVRRWVTELVAELKPTTVQRMMSDCRTYWTYLATIEVVSEESAPFDRLGLKVKNESWLPYAPEEAVGLLEAGQGDALLADVIRMAMYTGARREELCSLKVEHVKADRFEIVDAKTAAGIRTVPIHRQLSKTIKRLVKDSEDGYVLSGLKPNANGDRGDAIGKRFTRLKKSLEFSDRHTFHSLRGTVITMLER